MCNGCALLIIELQQANKNLGDALALIHEVEAQREKYRELLEILQAAADFHLKNCHPEPKFPQVDQWMN